MKRLSTTTVLAALSLGSVLLTTQSRAFTLEEFTFEDPARTREFRALIGELRCLVCQNESLAGSQASVAQDLRKEVYRLMQEGRSRQEVIDFLVARYGDFVLYDPPLKASTLVLWFGPFLFVGFGAYLLARTLQRKTAEPDQDLSETERARLQQLLAETGDQMTRNP
ncbi:cytochrome c-type biogenesis protein [Thermochromatium tepidum]|uniref:Cytochrome c-type biogenesis protein n=1 Tax=Thermochromatium tepidum ATCC 43061 TaxID=316276 RepID=A0A6I6EA29_THETI|nr:cytochrome c-type biogenesis protein [Thermochromatium tepidum]QGU32146.1 cytochrome c-type biogenesis protein CcmH [Thermochromatium tepidum ATCC 43061]